MKFISIFAVFAMSLGAASALANPAARAGVINAAELEKRSGGVRRRDYGTGPEPLTK